jgi:hypothetical protein
MGEIWMNQMNHRFGNRSRRCSRSSFPTRFYLAHPWARTSCIHAVVDHRTPLAVMLEDGLAGVIAVRVHLDCSYDWKIDAARR